jgi:IS1 family transposase
MGKRNKARIRDLLDRLKSIEIDFYATDGWKDFAALLPYFKHLIGKSFTKGIEGRNCWIRRRLSRLHRKSTTFSKKLIYHWYHSYGQTKISYHTFENTTKHFLKV